MNLITSAWTGNYQASSPEAVAGVDCIIAQSFGASETGPGRVNEELARLTFAFNELLLPYFVPVIAQQEVDDALQQTFDRPAKFRVEGDPSTGLGGDLDSWGVLTQAKGFMEERGLNRPLIIAQAHHVTRVAMQAAKQDMIPAIPEGLPRIFDPESTQIWTRNRNFWAPREAVGSVVLKLTGRL